MTSSPRWTTANASRGYDLLVAGGKPEAHVINAWPGNAIRVDRQEAAQAASKWHHVFVTYDGSARPPA